MEEIHRCDDSCSMHIRLGLPFILNVDILLTMPGPINKAASGTLTPSEENALLFELRHDRLYYEEVALAANSFLGMFFPPALNFLNQYGPRLKILLLRSDTARKSLEGRGRVSEVMRGATGAALALETRQSGNRLIDTVCSATANEANDNIFDLKLRGETQFQELVISRALQYAAAGRMEELDSLRRRLVTYFEDQDPDAVNYLPALVKAFKHLSSGFVFEETEENAVFRCREFNRFTERWAQMVEIEISNRRRSAESTPIRPIQFPNPRRRSAELVPRGQTGGFQQTAAMDKLSVRQRIEQMVIGRVSNRTQGHQSNDLGVSQAEPEHPPRNRAGQRGGRVAQNEMADGQASGNLGITAQQPFQPWPSNWPKSDRR